MKSPAEILRWYWRASRRVHIWLLGLAATLLILRIALPFAVEKYVNRQLNKANDYGGSIGGVNIQLWRGRYRINNPRLFKRSGEVQTPLFSADKVLLSIEWKELFHGSVVGAVTMDQAKINIVAGPSSADTQTGTNEGWNTMLQSLLPFDLNRFEVRGGQIHFQNEHSKPPVDIFLNELSLTATNLTNARNVSNALPAGVVAHSTTVGGGGMDVNLQLNPLVDPPAYQVVAQLTNVDLTALNDFLKAYGKFDVARGKFALYTSVAAKDGNYDGYIKVFFENLNVFAWEKERKKDALEIFWQAVVGTLTTAFKNHPKDSLATRIPISGNYRSQKLGVWTAVGTLLRNAFIRALVPDVDEKETIEKVEKKTENRRRSLDAQAVGQGIEELDHLGHPDGSGRLAAGV